MDLSNILSVSGYSGLYKLIAQAKNGIIVEALSDKKRFAVSGAKKVSSLKDVAIYTNNNDMRPLYEVFEKIYEKYGNSLVNIDNKTENEEIRKKFEEIMPDYDREKVYVSDMRKVFLWYNQLSSLGMVTFDKEEEVKSEEVSVNSEDEDKTDELVSKEKARKITKAKKVKEDNKKEENKKEDNKKENKKKGKKEISDDTTKNKTKKSTEKTSKQTTKKK